MTDQATAINQGRYSLDDLTQRLRDHDESNMLDFCRQLFRDAFTCLNMGEYAMFSDQVKAYTEWSHSVIAALKKEASEYVEDVGYVHTVEDLTNAFIESVYEENEIAVWTEDKLYTYTRTDGASQDPESEDSIGFFAGYTEEDVKSHLFEMLGNHPQFQTGSASKRVIERLQLKLAQPEFFANAPSGINLTNGFLRLNTSGSFDLEPHSPDHRARMKINAVFDEATDFSWLEDGLRQSLPSDDALAALQEAAGAILFNVTPRDDAERRMFFLHGPPRSGKSTIIHLLKALMPAEVVGSVPPTDWGLEHYRAELGGLLLNAVTELDKSRRINCDELKKIVSCEPVSARRMRANPFTFTPSARHLVATNELPRLSDKTGAFERRMLVISFSRLADDAVSSRFIDRVKANPSALINWAAAGAVRLVRRGRFTLPGSHKPAIAEMQYGDNPALLFAVTRLRRAPGERVTTEELRIELQAFLIERDNGQLAITDGTIKSIVTAMRALYGVERRMSGGRPFYEGVALVTDSTGGIDDAADADLSGI